MPPTENFRSSLEQRSMSKPMLREMEISLRRDRGEVSCAECKRRKLRCDRGIPCGNCSKRGKAHLCPNGMANDTKTPVTPSENQVLRKRIRELEAALAQSHAETSSEPHPLLLNATETNATLTNSTTEQIALATAALGTLAIKDSGDAAYFGTIAGTEAIYMAGAQLPEEDYAETDENGLYEFTEELIKVVSLGADLSLDTEGRQTRDAKYFIALDFLLSHLPDRLRASTLFEAYVEHIGWAFRPQTREQYLSDYIGPCQALCDLHWADPNSETWKDMAPHMLSVVFSIYSLGALGDLTLSAYNEEAERYHRLARAALQMRNILAPSTFHTIHALLILASYQLNSGKFYSVHSSWNIICMASTMAQGLGMHRDCSGWNMDAETSERRRQIWWEICSAEVLLSLHLGRPSTIDLSNVDCPYPESADARTAHAKYDLVKHVLSFVLKLSVSAIPTSYDKVLDADRRLRNYGDKVVVGSDQAATMGTRDDMQKRAIYSVQCDGSLILHRMYFVKALLDFPKNPLMSPYAVSFLATYRCSSWIIKNTAEAYGANPVLSPRFWMLWNQLFNAGVIMGGIVSRSPGCSIAATAFVELILAVELFEKGLDQTRRARTAWAILLQLRQKAQSIYYAFRADGIEPPSTEEKDLLDLLSLFGGQTPLVDESKNSARNSPEASLTPDTSRSGSHPASDEQHIELDSIPLEKIFDTHPPTAVDLHPSLDEFMGFFPASAFAPGFDVEGNRVSKSSAQMAIELESYSYPPSSLEMAQQFAIACDTFEGSAVGSHTSDDQSLDFGLSFSPFDTNTNAAWNDFGYKVDY